MGPSLPAGVERVLALAAAVDADAAQAARGFLADTLAGTPATWPGRRLGAGGCPLELAFAAGDPSLRLTVELGPPGLAVGDRAGRALALLVGADAGFAHRAGERLAALAGEPTVFGAWLGARFAGRRRKLKLYVELPGGAADVALAWAGDDLGDLARLRHRAGPPQMLGLDDDGGLELYFRARDLGRGELPRLLAPAGAAAAPARLDGLVAALARAVGHGFGSLLPCRDVGLSLAWQPGQAGARVTVYGFAHALFGGDGRIREAVLAAFAAAGWPAPLYEALSRPLVGRRGRPTRHGMFGFILGAAGAPAPVVGLAPEAAA